MVSYLVGIGVILCALQVEAIKSQPQLTFPPLTKQVAWATQQSQSWDSFIKYPSDSFIDSYVAWLAQRIAHRDVPSLYRLFILAWTKLSPVGAKGASRQKTSVLLFTLTQAALSFARLKAAFASSRWPCWFKNIWKCLPPQLRDFVSSRYGSQFFLQIAATCRGEVQGSVVYALFSHAGLYVGKADLHRQSVALGQHCGFPFRVVEHFVGITLPNSRDGTLPRYRVLRESRGSCGCLPLVVLPSSSQALACERAVISCLHPVCNGADWAALLNTQRRGVKLSPGKAIRARPIPAMRTPPKYRVSIWEQLQFQTSHVKAEVAAERRKEAWPQLPFNRLYRFMQQWFLAAGGMFGPFVFAWC